MVYMKTPLTPEETQRQNALWDYKILDTAPEQAFDDLTHLAAQICGVPMAAISLLDQERQWFKSGVGPLATEISREASFCNYTILAPELLLIPDTLADERFADNPFVTGEPHIRFYGGVPLVTPQGQAVGTLCVIDTTPRQLDQMQQDTLTRLGRQVVVLMEARRAANQLKVSEERYRRLFEAAKDGILILDAVTGQIEDVNPFLCQLLGYPKSDFLGRQLWEIGVFQDIAANQAAFRTLQDQEYIRYDDLPLATKDGRINSVEFVSNVYECAGKKVIQCNIRDLTSAKQEIAEQQRFFTLSLDMLWTLDLNGIFRRLNPAVEKVLGFTPEELIGQLALDYLHPDDRDASELALGQLATGLSVINYVNRFRCRDGSYKNILWVTAPYGDHFYAAGRDITEWVRAEEDARESQRFLQSTLDALASHITVLQEEGEIVSVNRAWQQFSEENEGTAASCGVGVNYLEVCDQATGDWSEEAPAIVQGIRQVLEGQKERFNLEYPCHSPVEQRWFNVSVTRFLVDGVARVVVAHENISARKQAEETLWQSEQQFRAVFQNSLDALIITDDEGRFLEVNPAACQLYSVSREQLVTMKLDDFTETSWNYDQAAVDFRAAGHERGEFQLLLPNGSRKYVEFAATANFLPGRHVTALRDITERKRAAEALRESEIRYRALAEAAPDDIFIVNHEGIMQYINQHGAQKFGLLPEDLVGKSQSDLFPPQVAEANQREFNQVFQSGQPLYQESSQIFQNRDLWLGIWFVPLKNEAGEVDEVMGVARDISMQKQTQATLRASEARYRSLFESNPQPMWVFDLETFDFLAVNDAAILHYGYSRDEFLAMTIKEIRPTEDLTALMAYIAQPSSHGGRHGFLRHRKKDGTIIEVEISAHELTFNERSACLVLAQDITERKQAETQRDRFFTMAVDILATFGMDGQFKRMNPAFSQTLGFTEDEIISKPFMEWVHPEDKAATLAVVATLAEGYPVLEFENRYRTKSGSYRWLEWTAVPVLEEGLIYAAARDVTERKQAEQTLQTAHDELESRVTERTLELGTANEHLHAELAERERTEETLREVQQRLQAVMYHLPQAIFWKDRDSKYLGCNYRLALDSGFDSPEDLIGKNDFDMPWAQYAQDYQSDDRQVMETDTPKLNIEEPLVKADGTPSWLRTNKVPLHDSENRVVGVLCSYEDVTEQKLAEAAIHEARREADAANMAKSEFLSRMSHELRTPLNAILGFGQLLNRQDLKPVQHESIGYILKGGHHLLSLINEVLDIARIEAGHIELSIEPIALHEVVSEVCALVRPLADQNDIRLVNDLTGRSNDLMGHPHVMADRQRLKQVIINLLSNAIKYNRRGGEVIISVSLVPDSRTQLRVQDSGLGLSPEDVQKLFTPFERLNAANLEIEGTGLGLVLSKRIVTAMNGTLGVESVLGQGSTFWVELPSAVAPVEALAELAAKQAWQAPREVERTYTVLSIEDNLSNIRLLEAILEDRPEITLLTAMQGSIGLDLARQHHPDLILLDLNMPGLSGSEVLKRLRQFDETKEIPVVIISADATPQQIERLLSAGARDYLTKPIDVLHFLNVLDEVFQLKDERAQPGNEETIG